jgi:hypothetical protein
VPLALVPSKDQVNTPDANHRFGECDKVQA